MGQIPMEKFLDLYALKHTEHARRKEIYKSAKELSTNEKTLMAKSTHNTMM